MAEETEQAQKAKARTIWSKPWPRWVLPLAFSTLAVLVVTFAIRYWPIAKQGLSRGYCTTRMKGLGHYVSFYESNQSDNEPVSWSEAFGHAPPPLKMLICRPSGTTPAENTTPSALEGHVDYVLVSSLGSGYPDDLVRAFELPANHRKTNLVNVLHSGGAVSGLRYLSQFMPKLQLTNDHLAVARKGM